MIKNVITYCLLISAATIVTAQTSFKAVANKTEVSIGEKIELSFMLTSDKSKSTKSLEFPSFQGFQMVGRSTSNNFSIRQGEMQRQYVETVILIPQKTGKITINPAKIKIGDKTISSNSVTINVTKDNSTRNSTNGEQIVFMEIKLSKEEAYPNEPIQAIIKLYARSYDALRRRSDLEVPGISGFQVKRINRNTDKRDFKQEVINNQVYVSEEIEAYSLLPQQTGEVTIPPFKIRVAIPLDFFDERIVLLKTDEKIINVKNLPTPIPKDFKGAIGNFKFNTFLEKDKAETNQSINYELELIGKGNLSGIKLPKIKLSEDLEVYPPKNRKSIQAIGQGQVGKIIDSYVIVPQYGGSFDIPEVKLTFFNPETEKYQTIKTERKTIEVQGEPKPKAITKAEKEEEETEEKKEDSTSLKIKIPNLDFKNIAFSESIENEGNSTENKFGYLWWTTLPIGLLGLFFVLRKKKRKKRKSIVFPASELKSTLKEMKELAKKKEFQEFYNQANILLNGVVCYAEQTDKNYTLLEGKEALQLKTNKSFANKWEDLNVSAQNNRYGQQQEAEDLLKEYTKFDELIKELLKLIK